MRSHYLRFLKGIKDGFLGHRWQLKMNNYYNAQSFRERGHERELPSEFIIRRIIYTRMLLTVDAGGPLEVFYIMRKAPVSWGPILLLGSIKDSSELYSRVTEHEEALLEAYRVSKGGNTSSIDHIVTQLKQMGFLQERHSLQQRANTVDSYATNSESLPFDVIAPASLDDLSSGQHVLHEAYQVLQQKQRPPPKGGYPFSKNDHVTTKMGRMPPSPCKCCGSSNHWDKECPDYNTLMERVWRSANVVEIWLDDGPEKAYASAYSILLNKKLSNHTTFQLEEPESNTHQGFKQALISSQSSAEKASKSSVAEAYNASRRTTIEEVIDEDWIAHLSKPKSPKHLLEIVDEFTLPESADSEKIEPNFRSPPHHSESVEPPTSSLQNEDVTTKEASSSSTTTGPPSKDARIKLKRRRFTPAGSSAVGVSVVAVQGWVGSMRNDQTDLQLDSCADVTLISQEYLESLEDRPQCQKGLKMDLWQLTDKDAKIQGYVRIPIFMESAEGVILKTEAEAYVVPNMTIPILLGEDYHLNYELTVAHRIDFKTVVNFSGVPHSVPARGVSHTGDFGRMRQSASAVASFIKSKLHKRKKAKKARDKKKFRVEQRTIRASEDCRLRPDECRRIRVDGHFNEDRTWLVEKNLLASANDSTFIVPNILISASNPWIPVSNPSPHPRMIRKGDVLGYLVDPQEFFDSPNSKEEFEKLARSAQAIAAIIAISEKSQGEVPLQTSPAEDDKAPEDQTDKVRDEEEESFGPKTAELPDLMTYPSEKMEEFLDVGSLPEHLRERAWEMLKRRQRAFGFDSRLGHHPSKVHIRTVDGQVPIAVPMYGASPAKRAIIDKQLNKWFEQDVIEPSKSPWSAPVVIAYRNGKPRFCVNYRKLNAATTPDEFPIPRQSEILSSLSGAQVLSSLDALSGFTQLEMHEDDVEKTAFRTHRGLFQFKRMPFSLQNGPSIFQQVMQGILAPYLWIFCLVYIDDIVIYPKTYEDHMDHLDKVLVRIRI